MIFIPHLIEAIVVFYNKYMYVLLINTALFAFQMMQLSVL